MMCGSSNYIIIIYSILTILVSEIVSLGDNSKTIEDLVYFAICIQCLNFVIYQENNYCFTKTV